jgi:hypothetical protein
LRLSQSSGCTPRTGRNAGGHDARSRPGAACEAARRHRPRPAIRIASGMRPLVGEELFPDSGFVVGVKEGRRKEKPWKQLSL